MECRIVDLFAITYVKGIVCVKVTWFIPQGIEGGKRNTQINYIDDMICLHDNLVLGVMCGPHNSTILFVFFSE